jgi:hypothetical protein
LNFNPENCFDKLFLELSDSKKKARHLAVTGLFFRPSDRAGLPRRPSGRVSPGSYQAVAGLLASAMITSATLRGTGS